VRETQAQRRAGRCGEKTENEQLEEENEVKVE
jgi:hypothetical protein